MTAVVSKNIQVFLHLTGEELKLKEELSWLSRTSTLETIPNFDVNSGKAYSRLKEQYSLLWQVHITDLIINYQTQIKRFQLMSLIFLRSGESKQ